MKDKLTLDFMEATAETSDATIAICVIIDPAQKPKARIITLCDASQDEILYRRGSWLLLAVALSLFWHRLTGGKPSVIGENREDGK